MDSLIQILDGLNGPTTLAEERTFIQQTFGNPKLSSKSDMRTPVHLMQSFLGVKADGIIGPQTRAAISNWQMANQVNGTGIWDVATKAKYESGAAVSVAPPSYTPTTPGTMPQWTTPTTISPLLTPPSVWPGATPPLQVTPTKPPASNATSFLDKLKGNTPTIALVAGGVVLLAAGIWYSRRGVASGSMAGCNC